MICRKGSHEYEGKQCPHCKRNRDAYHYQVNRRRNGLPYVDLPKTVEQVIPSTKPFIGWDGEGITTNPGEAQDYVLFGCSVGRWIKGESLSTKACLDLMVSVEQEFPDAIHVGFSFKYDVNMILKDIPIERLMFLFRHNHLKWEGYRLEYYPGKWFRCRRGGRGNPTIQLFDVFGFFQSSFVQACEEFVGKDDPLLARIREGKEHRKEFQFAELDDYVIPYWQSELEMLVKLMESLRGNLTSAGIKMNSWHGAGAVANSIFNSHNVKGAMNGNVDDEVSRGSQYAYAGGRFELFRCGNYDKTVWEYDINSAYPAAIANLPNLSKGVWRRTESFEPGSFGLWNISYVESDRRNTLSVVPQPLFCRHKQGHVSFPRRAFGWYWTPEASLVRESVNYGYVWENDNPLDRPFEFIRDMYETRRIWKAQGNNAQLAYKLGLNSIYGKMAQRIGGKENQAPKYHQLEWAGFVTSTVRAMLQRAICEISSAVIAVETDAIFSTQKIKGLTLGSGLGEWKETEFDGILYLQNGFYFANANGEWQAKYRGFDPGSIRREDVLRHLRMLDKGRERQRKNLSTPPIPRLKGTTTRFIGLGLALHTSSVWRSWEQNKKRYIDVGGGSKRKHIPEICPECEQGLGLSDTLHSLTSVTLGGRSYPHTLPWLAEDSLERYPWEVEPFIESW